MIKEEIKKLSNDIFTSKEEHAKISKIALAMSLVPLFNQIGAVFKTHTIGMASVFCILCSFICSILCVRNRENRNWMNIISIVISGFFIFVLIGIIILCVAYTIAYLVTH